MIEQSKITLHKCWDAFLEGFIPTRKNWRTTLYAFLSGAALAYFVGFGK